MPKVKVNDIEMYYEVHGEGTPLVMIQGFASSSEAWSKLIIEHLSQSHKVIINDNRGTGQTSCPDTEYSIQLMAEDIIQLLSVLDLPHAHIAGFSMGGLIVQEIAYRRPDIVKSLIIGCSASNFNDANKEFYDWVKVFSEGKIPEQDGAWLLGMCYTPEYIRDYMEDIQKRALSTKYPTSPIGYHRHAQATINYEGCDWTSKYSGPCLVIAGELDRIVDVDIVREYAESIPGSELKILEGASHFLGIHEAPDLLVSTILEFTQKTRKERRD